jgi:hypothetical protein
MTQQQSALKIFFKRLFVGLAFLVLAAHFSRAGNGLMMFLTLALMTLPYFRNPIATKIAQYALLLGGIEWLRAGYFLVMERLSFGGTWLRLAFIMLFVAVFTILASFAVPSIALTRKTED